MMPIKTIITEEEHQKALSRIEELMEAEPNTPEGDELDFLVTLVEKYEDKEYPINKSDFDKEE